jgi:hypothetical protein
MSNIPIDPNKFAAAFKKNNASVETIIAPAPVPTPVKPIPAPVPTPVKQTPAVVAQPAPVPAPTPAPTPTPVPVVVNESEEKSNKYTIIAFAIIIIILIIVIVYFVSNYAPNIYSKLPFISAPAVAAAPSKPLQTPAQQVSNEDNMKKIAELASNKTEPISIDQINDAANNFEFESDFPEKINKREEEPEPEQEQYAEEQEPEHRVEIIEEPTVETPEPKLEMEPIVKKKQGKGKKAKIVEVKNDDMEMKAEDIFDFDL